jgi:hypothetical protein
MAKEFYYPDWIEYNLIKGNFIYNSEYLNYRYKNTKYTNKAYKFIFDPIKDHPNIKRGDLIRFTKDGIEEHGYRNDGVWIWDGQKLCQLDTDIDDYGSIPSNFKIGKEFNYDHWKDKISHNSIFWLEDELHSTIKFYEINNNKFEGSVTLFNQEYKISVDTLDDLTIKIIEQHITKKPYLEFDTDDNCFMLRVYLE